MPEGIMTPVILFSKKIGLRLFVFWLLTERTESFDPNSQCDAQ
jgi:hypothetical protein